MKYFKINANGTKWESCDFDKTKRQITLYDYDGKGGMIEIGTGLY